MLTRRKLIETGAAAGIALTLPAFKLAPAVNNSAYRSPTPQDDITRGNVVNGVNGYAGESRLWLNLSTGQFFRCTNNTANVAVWSSLGIPTVLPGDAVAGVTAAYGTKRVVAAWGTGALFDLYNGTTTTTIHALANGKADVAAINTALITQVPGYVSKWYDQSGANNDATQSAASGPIIRVLGDEVYIVFDHNGNPSHGTTQLTLPSVAWGSSISLFQQSQMWNVGGTQGWRMMAGVELGTVNTDYQSFFVPANVNTWRDASHTIDAGANSNYLTTADCNPTVFGMISSSSAATFWWAERQVTNAGCHTIGSPTGGLIGTGVLPTNQPYYFNGTLQCLLIWGNLAMSSAQSLSVRQALYQLFKTVPQASNDLILTDGDSWLSADRAYNPQPVANFAFVGGGGYLGMLAALPLLNRPCRWINTAISGELLGTIQSNYATRDEPLKDPNCRANIYILEGGDHEGDDLKENPPQVLTLLESFCTTIAATGWTSFYYITIPSWACPLTAGTPAVTGEEWRETGVNAFNPLVRTAFQNNQLAGVTGLIDWGDTSTPIGKINGYLDTNYFWPDEHIGGNGSQGTILTARMFATAINATLGAI